jgi:hypothetical protein
METQNKCSPGARFNHFVVLEKVGGKQWVCQCVCGKRVIVCSPWGGNARKSCGCQRIHWRLKDDPHREIRRIPPTHMAREDAMVCGCPVPKAQKMTWNPAEVTCVSCLRKMAKVRA